MFCAVFLFFQSLVFLTLFNKDTTLTLPISILSFSELDIQSNICWIDLLQHLVTMSIFFWQLKITNSAVSLHEKPPFEKPFSTCYHHEKAIHEQMIMDGQMTRLGLSRQHDKMSLQLRERERERSASPQKGTYYGHPLLFEQKVSF